MVVRLPEVKKYLNRDGLEEYNSLLPHSSTEIEEYVSDWLDEHPEATTTVQDGSITTQKLADASVTRNKLAADVAHLLGGMMLTGELQGEILSASDAYSVAPLSMTIDGKSTQDGTPTPDNPVPIDSIEVLELPVTFVGKNLLDPSTLSSGYIASDGSVSGTSGASKHSDYMTVVPGVSYRISEGGGEFSAIYTAFYDINKARISSVSQRYQISVVATAPDNAAYMRSSFNGAYMQYAMIEVDSGSFTGFVPYAGITTQIPMQGHVLRSLPDGTHDTMSLSYLRESDRTGWALYSREFTRRIHHEAITAFDQRSVASSGGYRSTRGEKEIPSAVVNSATKGCCSHAPWTNSSSSTATSVNRICAYRANSVSNILCVVLTTDNTDENFTTLENMNAWLATHGPIAVDCELVTPIITQLDPIELPVLPAPNCTVWADPTTGLKMSYMRDANIVISDIEQAIADQ